MEVISLQSGSNGNAFYVRAANHQFMFDAGISGSVAQARLAERGRDIRDVQTLFISHDHTDHSRCMGVYQRKFGHSIYVTRETLAASQRSTDLGQLSDINYFTAGETIDFGEVQVHTVPTPHDSADGVAFVVEHDDKRLGILTDLGHVFDGLRDVLLSLDAVIIESNYDPQMLDLGFYPERLKRRIRGSGGHISNDESAQALRESIFFKRLKWACLCHLSDENNRPDVAIETHRRILGSKFPIHVARRDQASEILEI